MTIKYFGRINFANVSRYPLEGNSSLAWQILKLGSKLVKEGLFLFWIDAWDQHPTINERFPIFHLVKDALESRRWKKIENYLKNGQNQNYRYNKLKNLQEWPIPISLKYVTIILNISSHRLFISSDMED